MDLICICFVLASPPPSTSASAGASSSSSPALDSAAHHSCYKCSRRMSSYTYDKHTYASIVGMFCVQWAYVVGNVVRGPQR